MDPPPWLDLPLPVWHDVLRRLPLRGIAAFAASCTQARSVAADDGLWAPLCARYGAREPGDHGYRALYTRLLRLIGVWSNTGCQAGSLLQVELVAAPVPAVLARALVAEQPEDALVGLPIFVAALDSSGQLCAWCARRTESAGTHTMCVVWQRDAQGPEKLHVSCPTCSPQGVHEVAARLRAPATSSAGERGAAQRLERVQAPDPWLARVHMLRLLVVSATCKELVYERLPVPAGRVHVLEGLWRGTYGMQGMQLLSLAAAPPFPSGSAAFLAVTKLQGDECVPAGQVSVRFSAPAADVLAGAAAAGGQPWALPQGGASDVVLGQDARLQRALCTCAGEGQVALPGHMDAEWVAVEVVVFSVDMLGVWWPTLGKLSLYTRLQLDSSGCGTGSRIGPVLHHADDDAALARVFAHVSHTP